MSEEVAKLYIEFDADGRAYVKGLRTIEGETDKSGRRMEDAWNKYGKKAALAMAGVAAAAAGIGVAAVKAAATFEYEFSRIKANANATGKEMDALRELTLQLGADTAFSAGEAAQAANELVKAGMSVGDTMKALPGMLDLAAAGELGVAQAAEITANNLNTFGLAAEDAAMVADTLASAANQSTTDVTDLGLSLKMSASVTSTAGMSFQETAGALALLANNGLKGSDAGTSLKSMFMQLQAPSDKARDILSKYNIELYDAQGNMYDFADIIAQFEVKLAGATQEERDFAAATVFGSDAVRSANILIREGSDAYKDMVASISESGAAQDVARTKMDNFYGSIEELKGSLETMAISIGTKMLPKLREWAESLTDIVNEATETGDWSRVGERIGELVAEGIETATPYIMDALWTATKAGAKGLLAGAMNDALNMSSGSDFTKMRDYIAERMAGVYRDVPKTQAFQKALEDLQSNWFMGAFTKGKDFNVPKAQSKDDILALAAAMGLTLTPEGWEIVSDFNASMITGNTLGSLWSPGSDPGAAFRGMATGMDVATKSAAELAEIEAKLAAEQAEVQTWTDLLTKQFETAISPADAWANAISKGEEAAKEAGVEFQITTGTLKDMAKELAGQVEAWAAYEQNIVTLVDRWGTEFGPEVIMKAAELGPEFVKALVGGDEEVVRKTFQNLEDSLDNNITGISAVVTGKYREIGENAGKSGGIASATSWSEKWWELDVPGKVESDLDTIDHTGKGGTGGTDYATSWSQKWWSLTIPAKVESDLGTIDHAGKGATGGTTYGTSWETGLGEQDLPTYISGEVTYDASSEGKDSGISWGSGFKSGLQTYLNQNMQSLKGLGLFPSINIEGNSAGGDLGMALEEYLRSQTPVAGMTPHTTAVWNAFNSRFPSATFLGGKAERSQWKSDHPAGKAFDIGGADKRSYADWLASNFDSLGLKYIIYAGQINYGSGWDKYTPPRALRDSASYDTAYHFDHVHVSTKFHDGGYVPGNGDVPAILAGGEYVMTGDEANALVNFLNKLGVDHDTYSDLRYAGMRGDWGSISNMLTSMFGIDQDDYNYLKRRLVEGDYGNALAQLGLGSHTVPFGGMDTATSISGRRRLPVTETSPVEVEDVTSVVPRSAARRLKEEQSYGSQTAVVGASWTEDDTQILLSIDTTIKSIYARMGKGKNSETELTERLVTAGVRL
jgi:TP901 family phage tail tape measure protein